MPPRPTPLHLTLRLPTLLTHHHHHHHLPPALKPPYQAPTTTTTSPLSTTAIGTNYERLALLALQPLAFDLRRVGGRADKGIDLIGTWRLPPSSPFHPKAGGAIEARSSLDIPVIAQCKAHASTPHPAWVRELEGALAAAPGGSFGVLVSKGKATPGVREAVMRAEGRGLVWVQMGGEGRVGQVLWNRRVGEVVGKGWGVGVVYSPVEGGVGRELRLMYEGRVWEPEG
ncbi:MAG: hypothetical protein OHK93_000493 [Ramalina farinacea]|uniref:Restriction endonuclease type IV Mrr domain-containing protein n=1 Tax=Ramalina farinacea TaxID=258253 RepID=A0AA43TNE3_9LECA|nr:hypothetical protein [Ramalina farinacea]